MSNFKLIFLGVFVAAAIFGILVFAGIINIGGSNTGSTDVKGAVTVWGTFPSSAMDSYISDFNLNNHDINLTYVEKDPTTFDQTLVESLATGNPPDLVLLPDDLLWRFQDKLTHIPFASLPAQTFQSTFVSSANVFATTDGSLAVPWAADPLVMYYNRDMLESAGIVEPPTTWDAFVATIPLLTKKQTDLTLTQEGAALGSYENIEHAKDILALLFLESGSQFITQTAGALDVHFGVDANATEETGAENAMNFYMGFSDPLKQAYTWNAGEPLDRDAFIQSNLAYYFGTASELPIIRAQNPNLNFGIALPPQSPSGASVTTGHVYGFAIPKSAPNQLLSFTATTLLSNMASETALETKLGSDLTLIPIRRDVLAQKPTDDPYIGFLFDAALVQKTWTDPSPVDSDQIFDTLVKDINSSTLGTADALTKAGAQLSALSGSM